MAASFNKVILVANLTRDVELKHLQSGTVVAELGLAVNDRVKKGDQWVDEACFIDCTCFGRTAEIAGEYLAKGSPVLIEGRLKFNQWEKDGERRSKHTVICENLRMVGGKPEGDRQPRQSRQERREPQSPPPDGFVPF